MGRGGMIPCSPWGYKERSFVVVHDGAWRSLPLIDDVRLCHFCVFTVNGRVTFPTVSTGHFPMPWPPIPALAGVSRPAAVGAGVSPGYRSRSRERQCGERDAIAH